MSDAWIFNGTTQGREIRAILTQQPVHLRPGEQARVTGHPDGVALLLEHMKAFGIVEADAEDPMPVGKLVWHKTELKDVRSSGTLEVEAPPKDGDEPGPLNVAAPKTSSKRNDGVEK